MGKSLPNIFFKIRQNSNSSPLQSGGDPAVINQNHLILLSFGSTGDIDEGIILGDNPAGHCFLLTDLIPMNFIK